MILFCPLEEIGNTLLERQIEQSLSLKYSQAVKSTLYMHNFSYVDFFDLVCDCDIVVVLLDEDDYIDELTIEIIHMAKDIKREIEFVKINEIPK